MVRALPPNHRRPHMYLGRIASRADLASPSKIRSHESLMVNPFMLLIEPAPLFARPTTDDRRWKTSAYRPSSIVHRQLPVLSITYSNQNPAPCAHAAVDGICARAMPVDS